MPKIYGKTIVLVVAVVLLALLRFDLLVFSVPLPNAAVDVLIALCVVAIIINEKWTHGEKWKILQYVMFIVATVVIVLVRVHIEYII